MSVLALLRPTGPDSTATQNVRSHTVDAPFTKALYVAGQGFGLGRPTNSVPFQLSRNAGCARGVFPNYEARGGVGTTRR